MARASSHLISGNVLDLKASARLGYVFLSLAVLSGNRPDRADVAPLTVTRMPRDTRQAASGKRQVNDKDAQSSMQQHRTDELTDRLERMGTAVARLVEARAQEVGDVKSK